MICCGRLYSFWRDCSALISKRDAKFFGPVSSLLFLDWSHDTSLDLFEIIRGSTKNKWQEFLCSTFFYLLKARKYFIF